MAEPWGDTEQLLEQARNGDAAARGKLFEQYRTRLARMIALRMDPRLTARLDPSDVVQETLGEAALKLPQYLERRPLPFYPWLRQLALENLATLYRRHVQARKRSVTREHAPLGLQDHSALELADRLCAQVSSPSARLRREEVRQRVQQALAQLGPFDREVLVLRHLEQLTPAEIAAVLSISEGAVYTRHLRALQRLRDLLQDESAADL